ncbi:hypothetical protein ASG22_09165 [Chryseobacterium sp. Leaf405]|uniref:hypothetical protein n=1 Tax=Chryseobacterium sp. Leaf405 TaxID=1736367 RepID=UPI0006F66DD1|nr:hypothetical protein [Chryseobacterium sp. Leaf405]KQT24174.1 hypothetical protein ASG22_09165 [Chryseobacterium sp. Leaf405]
MSPLPELNLSFGMNTKSSSSDDEKENIVVRTDSGFRKHTISMIISDQEVGKVLLKINKKEIEVPTYKLTITDDKTNETEAYQVTRDTLHFVKSTTKKSFLSFLGIKRFDKTSFLYENIAYEPLHESVEKFDISRHRSLTQDKLSYQLSRNGQNIMLYSGDMNEFKKAENISQYFIIVDNNEGKSFIGDIVYREKFLKLTPKVGLQIIRRNKVAKSFEYDEKGNIKRLIYL